jgi:hypothetical protein
MIKSSNQFENCPSIFTLNARGLKVGSNKGVDEFLLSFKNLKSKSQTVQPTQRDLKPQTSITFK